MNVLTKPLLLTLAFSVILYFGCSDDHSGVNTANQLLEKAYQSYMDGDPSQALIYVNASLAYDETRESLAFKSQVEYVLGDQTAAYDTLSTFEALYPNDGGDDLLRAYFLSNDAGDCDQTSNNLETALNDNYGDMSCESYWEMVETEEGFSYFRDSCPTQYAVLEGMKTGCPTEETPEACKENKTKFEKKWYGPELWIKNSDMGYLDDVHKLEAFIAKQIPGWGKILAGIIKARSTEIKAKNRGCGVVLHWTWVTWGLISYWVTAQK